MSGYTMTQAELLYTLAAPVTKNTYTSSAVFSAPSATAPVAAIPAQYFGSNPNGVGRALYLKAMGSIATTAAATFAPTLGIDSAAGTLANGQAIYAATAPTAAVTAQWLLEAWITCQAVGQGGGMTLQVNGKWDQSILATGGALSTAPFSAQFAGSVTGLLASTQYFLELWGVWSASAAGNTTTLQQMLLFGLN